MRQMKDSGVEWIGEIPQDWNFTALKRVAFIQTGNTPSKNRQEIYYSNANGIPWIKADNMGTYRPIVVTAEYLTSAGANEGRIFPPNTVYVCCIASVGKVGYSNITASCNQQINALLFNELYFWKYGYYVTLAQEDEYQVKANGNVVKILNTETQSNLIVPIPTITEQNRIATFLDKKCTEIDNAIAKTTASIEEYKKFKQAIITKAVTKGICGNRPMKDSGIEWIGEIPSDWEICKVRHIGTLQNGISKGGEFFGSGFPFVSYGDVYRNISLPACVDGLVQSSSEEQKLYSVQEGDIFFTRTSETIEEVGFSSVCENDIPKATFAGFLIRLRPNKNKIYSGFSKYYFRSSHHRSFLIKEMNLVTRASLGQSLLKSMFVLLPGMNEQYEIAEYLDSKCNEIDNITSRKQQLITELEAYKKSLIYEYVTGKKEVV